MVLSELLLKKEFKIKVPNATKTMACFQRQFFAYK